MALLNSDRKELGLKMKLFPEVAPHWKWESNSPSAGSRTLYCAKNRCYISSCTFVTIWPMSVCVFENEIYISISTNGRLHKYNPTVSRKVIFFPRLFMWGGLSAESEMSGTTGQAFPDWWKRLSAWHSYRNSHQHWPSNAIQNTKYKI